MSILSPTTDFFGVFADATEADIEAWQKVHDLTDEFLNVINKYWDESEYNLGVVKILADNQLLNDRLDLEGFPKLSPLGQGLVNMELSRIDGSVATIVGVQAALCMRSIATYGTQEQKDKWLLPLAKGEKLGAFAMTEPNHGSDAVALETTAVRDGDEYVINGEKRWIGNGAGGDVAVVWARQEDGQVGGFIVEQSNPGYSAEVIRGKISLRALHQAHITLDNVRIPAENKLPDAHNFKDAAAILENSRAAIAWSSLGHAIAGYEGALAYARERVQFGRPLIKNQLIQQRFADMLIDITNIALQCRQLARLEEAGQLHGAHAALGKVHGTRTAKRVLSDARDMLGGNGILLENHIARHYADMEALHTYEGTDSVQSLILGRVITGESAFV